MYLPSNLSSESEKDFTRKGIDGYMEMYLPNNQMNIKSPMFCNKYKIDWNAYGISNENDINKNG